VLTACGGGGVGGGADAPAALPSLPPVSPPAAAPLSAKALLGEKIFADRNLSGSGRMSCASCHDPAFAHGPPNAAPVQVGGAFETEFGLRAAPSLRYLERNGGFSGTAQTRPEDFRGGLMADGRADSLAAQARLPWFNPREMDNGDAAVLARKLRASAYAAEFQAAFGSPAADDESWVDRAGEALQAFQREDRRFHPYSAKLDRVLAGQERLSAAESRGLLVFRDPQLGNCASCHPADVSGNLGPVFSTFGYAALGVPRNPAIPRNGDAGYFDLGLCQSTRPEVQGRAEACGFFRIPGLRNVAERPVFFHNGQFNSLEQVLRFYNTRDSRPELWYPVLGGEPQRFNDLPAAQHLNINRQAPFASQPLMSEADLADVICFLRTLSDGHVPNSAPRSECQR